MQFLNIREDIIKKDTDRIIIHISAEGNKGRDYGN